MTATENPIPTNKPGSREFEETMATFEQTIAKGATREAKEFWKHRAYYTDGATNSLFLGYLHGIAYARSIVNLA